MLGIKYHSFSSSVILHLRVFPCISVGNAARARATGQCVYFAFFRFVGLFDIVVWDCFLNRFLFVHSSPLVNELHIRHDGIPVKAFLLFFLIFLQTTISCHREVLLPSELPAPEGQSPAAGAHPFSCCRNELCSLLERDRGIEIYCHIFSFVLSDHTTSWDTCQPRSS